MNKGIKNINIITTLIAQQYNITYPIDNINKIVDIIGGYIKEDDELSGCSDGFIMKDGDSFKIVVSPYQTAERRHFTIAHELGHLFLHMGYKIDEELWDRQTDKIYYRPGSTLMEDQAKEFALALLMPSDKYIKIFTKCLQDDEICIDRVKKIAKYFNVSFYNTVRRGQSLNLIQ